MRDVISNETIKEINEVIDEILTNIDDNVRNIVGAGNYSLPTIFSYTNYSGQTINVHGSTFRHEIIIDNADGNNLIGDICTVIGDRNGIKLAKAGVEDRHDTFANYWDSTFDIAYSLDNIINGYVFDMHNGYVGEGANSSTNMSFKIDGLEIGKSYTLTFTGRFARAEFVVAGDSYARICSDINATPYIASVTLEKDTVGHVYRLDFTNNTQSTTLYLNFDFLSLSYEESSYVSEFIAENLVIAGMNIGIISRYMHYNRKWYPIEAGGGTSDLDAIELTYAEYQTLSPAEKTDPDKIYFITDYPSGSGVVINPTGTATDTAETIEVDGTIYDFMDADAVHTADIGVAGGVAELDANGKVPSSQLPSYVDDVVEYASISAFPATGESGKIYIALDTNKTYRWTGSVYVEISPSLALGETSSTAYRGDRGKTAYDHSQSDHSGIAPAFTEASTRANIASGETFATLLGKIKKFFSDLKAVAFSGSYNDLSDTPTIPAAQVNSDWNATSGKAQILNKPSLATVATSGSYNDLSNKPTIPTVNNATLTIQKNGTNVETFTANASSNKTANITVPTKVSELTNDSGFVTTNGTVAMASEHYNMQTVDLSSLNASTYYPVTGTTLSNYYNGMVHMVVHVALNSGTKPSWSTHNSGFSVLLDILNEGYGWGTTEGVGICLAKSFRHCNSMPCGYSQMVNSSTPVFWCRGGGKYHIYSDHPITWTVRSSTYTVSSQSVSPTTTYPGVTFPNPSTIEANLKSNSATFTGAVQATGIAEFTGSPTYLLGIEAFASGGDIKWKNVGNVKVGEADKATQDGDGNTISSTYMKVSAQPTLIFNKIPTGSAVTSTISSIADYKFLIFNITSNAYKSINWGSYIIPVAIVSSHYGSSYNGIIVRSMLNTSQYVEIAFLSATSVSIKGTNWQNSERVICYAY